MPSNNGGGGRGPWGPGPTGGPRQHPDLEQLLKRGQDRFKQVMPGGSGLPGSLMFLVLVMLTALVAFYAFTFRVSPDELGVVMRFGKPVRQEPPGLHFRLPYPIDEVRLPKVTRQNIIEIGFRAGVGTRTVSDLPRESLMLTGDENIVDIHVVVFWRIRDAQKYLFNIQNPEATVKDVAESAMRDIVGQSNIQPLRPASPADRQEVASERDNETDEGREILQHHGEQRRVFGALECSQCARLAALGVELAHRYSGRHQLDAIATVSTM